MLKTSRLALVALGVLTVVVVAAQPSSGPLVAVVIRDVAVLDPTVSRWLAHQDIVITGTTVTSVTPTGGMVPPAKTTIHGAGKFAIPGLFDNHARLARFTRDTAALFVANGITSVRDVGTEPSRIAEWRRDIAYGKFMGPRIVSGCGTTGVECATAPMPEPAASSVAAVHDELSRLVRDGGVTPAAALRSATLGSAQFQGRSADLGSIEAGKIADLVILAGDPLADIHQTQSIDAVIFRGEALTRAHLNVLARRAAR